MPYYAIDNFAAGMDVRKSALTAPAGTLRLLKNAHVTAGGEIEKRQAFQLAFTASAAQKGLASLNGYPYVFTTTGVNIPASNGVLGVHVLELPVDVTITEVLDWDTYDGKFFTIVRGSDGIVYRTYNGAVVPDARGFSCRTYKSKIYTVEGSTLYFSAIGDPTDWLTALDGAGFINLAVEDSEMSNLVGLEVYYDKLAVFSDRACQIWSVDPDPNKNQITQTLRQAGTDAPKSIRQYGSGDVLYLAPDGIRSLKARLQSITASVSDIGSPVDNYIRDLISAGNYESMKKSISLLEPLTGRYWIVMQDSILVLSNYPNPEISAWGVYIPSSMGSPFQVTDAVAAGASIYLRGVDGKIYKYGNTGTPVYCGCEVEVVLPYLSFNKPATFKQFTGVDLSAVGDWSLYAALNPHDQNAEDLLGTVSGPTFLTGQFAMSGHSTHVSLRLRSSSAQQISLSNIMIHFEETETT